MAEVLLENVCKHFGEVVAVNNFNMTINDKEFVVLVGPSGCGKTTTLRMVAGLESITGGDILVDGQKINDLHAKDRNIAMVFQNYALYPHMSVFQNMAFSLQNRGRPVNEIKERVQEAAEILGIEHLLDRKPKQLSGGQRQRVAVGRAIVRKPKVFLFDEPLSNLDAKLRVQTRMELKKLHERLATTAIYVTHDQVEAMTMGDRIVVMSDGLVQQIGAPLELYNKPANKFVAGFLGSPAMNFFEADVVMNGDNVELRNGCVELVLPEDKAAAVKASGVTRLTAGIRPEDIALAARAEPGRTIGATVEVVEPIGSETYIDASTGPFPLIAGVGRRTIIRAHEAIMLKPNLNQIHLFDLNTGDSLVNGK